MTSDVAVVADAVACFGLPDTDVALPRGPLAPAAWTELLRLVLAERLAGPLAWALAAGAWDLPADARDDVAVMHRQAMALTLQLDRDLLSLAADLDASGIAFRVLKGTAAAHLDEPDPSWRAFGDIDLLVRGDDMDRIGQLLIDRGGQRRYPEPRPGFDRRFTKGTSWTFAHNCEIDVHRTLASGPFGLSLALDELFEGSEDFMLGPRRLPALDRPSRFLHACYHAVLGSPRARGTTLRDLVHTAPADAGELRATLARAERSHGTAVVATAVRLTRQRFSWRPPAELAAWSDHLSLSRQEQRWLGSSMGADRSYARQMLTGLEAVRGPADKLAYALAVTFPVPTSGRAPSIQRWQRGWQAVRQTFR